MDIGSIGKATRPSRRKTILDALWEGLADGTIEVVASDHVPRKRATKEKNAVARVAGIPRHGDDLPVLLVRGIPQGAHDALAICELLTSRRRASSTRTAKGTSCPGTTATWRSWTRARTNRQCSRARLLFRLQPLRRLEVARVARSDDSTRRNGDGRRRHRRSARAGRYLRRTPQNRKPARAATTAQ